jgi:DNA-binding CsgD family transcriptional regulator
MTPHGRQLVGKYLGHRLTPGKTVPEPLASLLGRVAPSRRPRWSHSATLQSPEDRFVLVLRHFSVDGLGVVVLHERQAAPDRLGSLTRREVQVLALAAEGKANKEVAILLNLGERTVKHHLERVYRKLNVENRTEAAGAFLGGAITATAIGRKADGHLAGSRRRAS